MNTKQEYDLAYSLLRRDHSFSVGQLVRRGFSVLAARKAIDTWNTKIVYNENEYKARRSMWFSTFRNHTDKRMIRSRIRTYYATFHSYQFSSQGATVVLKPVPLSFTAHNCRKQSNRYYVR